MQNEFDNALEGLLNFKPVDSQSADRYNELFKQLISSSMKICSETDYAALVKQKADSVEKKYGVKMETSDDEGDVYKKLREVVRFEMARESILNNREHEVCCTESNFRNAVGKFRGELEKIVPESQMEVLESMSQSLYSDFTNFFVCASMDLIADAKIYQMKEFRPLQLNAMGKEIRTYVNVIKLQNAKPQKSQVVTDWFRSVMVLPAFLFRKLYGVSFVEMFEVPQKLVDDVAHTFNIFQKNFEAFTAGDEYRILHEFLRALNLENCFTVRIKIGDQNRKADKAKVN